MFNGSFHHTIKTDILCIKCIYWKLCSKHCCFESKKYIEPMVSKRRRYFRRQLVGIISVAQKLLAKGRLFLLFCDVYIHLYIQKTSTQAQIRKAAVKDSIAKLTVHLNHLFLFTLFHLFAHLVAITRGKHVHFPFFFQYWLRE